ncbi:MAG TPA: sigma-54 dependent transcriptional regulator [Candidatus Tectomicrobia bacterium]|nr:sigma-54 dependent transcriptional regulator [Candidatus Tectomicrobia bacterium]
MTRTSRDFVRARASKHDDRDREEVERLRAQLTGRDQDDRFEEEWQFANSAPMRAVKATIDSVAATDVTVLVWGESGVGKEVIPKLLHWNSPRRDQPFVKVNCAALPLDLLESEMFGYERGAFTGAHRQKAGKFEAADKGTIFLDEIGELPWPLQAKLLHVLQDREFTRLGSAHTVRVDVRVVAATNKDLGQLVQQRLFREDLYYRLNVVNVRVPALRQRREEIPFLVDHFLKKFSQQYGRRRAGVRAETMRHFLEYRWPGNVRELENTIKRIVVLGTESWVFDELRLDDVRVDAPARPATTVTAGAATPVSDRDVIIDGQSLTEIGRRAAAEAERLALTRVLEEVRWNRMEAARRLKVNYKTILAKIEEYGIGRRRARRAG